MSDSIECPECRRQYTRVIDSRPSYERGSIRRRRECLGCLFRWSTYEVDADRLDLLEENLRHQSPDAKRAGTSLDETRPGSCF